LRVQEANLKPVTRTADRRPLHAAGRAALAHYDLTEVRLRLVGDVHNAVFRVSARDQRGERRRFALRLHVRDWLSDAEIASEMAWLEAIRRETSFLVPDPVRNDSGRLLTHARTDADSLPYTCTLLRWIDGRRYWKRPSVAWVRRVGGLMAQLQRHGRRFERPDAFRRPRWEAPDLVGRRGVLAEGWAPLPGRAGEVLSAVADRFLETAAGVGIDADSFGLIHGDLHVANALSCDGRIAAIDFDDCCDGYDLFDLAAALDLLEFRANYPALRRALLDGYCEVRPEAAEHLGAINAFLAARWVMVCLSLARRIERRQRLRRALTIVIPKLRRFLGSPASLG